MATINVSEELWKRFRQQSIEKGRSASSRLVEFMREQLKEAHPYKKRGD
jgi:hypothetical protein